MFSILLHFEQKFQETNSVDTDQKPHSAASELGMNCLGNTLKWVSGLNRVKLKCLWFLLFKRTNMRITHSKHDVNT